MAKQNIYDNETFYEGYKKIREKKGNANTLFEIPALMSLLPDLEGKRVLDLGCGFGEHCKMFVDKGATRVVGIDISEKMLATAREENADSRIEYINMAMEDIGSLTEEFDLVISSLAFHYVEDFKGVADSIYKLLSKNGVLVFSQENPIVTAHSDGDRWTMDENGNKLHYNLTNYGVEGERDTVWFVDNVKKYHRTFSTVVNTLIDAGFTVERIVEPLPNEEILKEFPDHRDLFHKPDFMLIKAGKH